MTSTRAKALVALNWTLALFVVMYPLFIPWDSIKTNLGRYYIVVITICVIFFNVYLFRKARIHGERIKRQQRIITGLQKNLKEDFKSVRTLAIVGGTFLVSCLPFTAVTFIYGNDKMTVEFQRSAAFAGILMPINAILDPLIYYFRSAEFRAFYQKFKRSSLGQRIRKFRTPMIVYKNNKQIKPAEHN